MTWARFEDRFPWHRKVRGLSDAAFRLHVSAVCWACEHLTDGKVETDDLPLVSDVRKPTTAVGELERKGLWEVLPDGWLIHDFLTYNESRDTVLARREADAERKRKGREGRKGSGSPSGVQPDSAAESPPESVRPVPSRPVPNPTSKTSAAPDGFAEFWLAYPRKVAKPKAEAAYRKALKTTEPSVLLDAARAFARQRQGQDQTFTPHPSSWLNGGQWADEEPRQLVPGRDYPSHLPPPVNETAPRTAW